MGRVVKSSKKVRLFFASFTFCAALALALALALSSFGSSQGFSQTISNDQNTQINAPTVRALILARDRAMLSAELATRIADMPVRPGERFREGDRLVRFDCGVFTAQRDAAKAELRASELNLEALEKLLALNAKGPVDVEIAKAERDSFAANLRLAQESVNRCSIRAPYDGQVVAWHAHPHESASPGVDLIEVVATRTLEVEMIIPSAWLAWLKPAMPISLLIDETGNAYGASISVIGAEVDPVSQTLEIRAQFDTPPKDLISGMSGVAILPTPEAKTQ